MNKNVGEERELHVASGREGGRCDQIKVTMVSEQILTGVRIFGVHTTSAQSVFLVPERVPTWALNMRVRGRS